MREFKREFIALASNAPEIPDPILEMAFVTGLRPQIQARIKLMGARGFGLQKVMDVAKMLEDWAEGGETTEEPPDPTVKTGRSSEGKSQTQTSRPAQSPVKAHVPNKNRSPQTKTTASNNTGTRPNHNRVKPPFRRLTPAEIARYKTEGLCFRCDEKYVYPHKCAQPELVMMMVLEDGTELDVSNFSVELKEEQAEEEVEVAEISINYIVGISSSRTMKRGCSPDR